ncbi:hypothetical protein ABPG77_009560 [Micractinium sp. CCAP 211/92]
MSIIRGVQSLESLRFRLVDAKGQVVGRLASQIATILQGKDKPTYCPNKDDGDVVVVVNAADVELTGRKWDQKMYRWHTGYPGGLKERTAKQMFAKQPDSILREAVMGMLPKNNLRRSMARKLRIFPGERHDFEGHPALLAFQMPPRKLREKGELFELPPGFEPLNTQAYFKRFGHRLGKQQQGSDAAQQQAAPSSET